MYMYIHVYERMVETLLTVLGNSDKWFLSIFNITNDGIVNNDDGIDSNMFSNRNTSTRPGIL